MLRQATPLSALLREDHFAPPCSRTSAVMRAEECDGLLDAKGRVIPDGQGWCVARECIALADYGAIERAYESQGGYNAVQKQFVADMFWG